MYKNTKNQRRNKKKIRKKISLIQRKRSDFLKNYVFYFVLLLI